MRALLKQASVKRFDHLTSLSLKHWMREEARSHGITLTEESVRALTDIVGTDQWYLHWEIAKLALLGKELPSREDISAVCLPGGAQTVWHLRDLLARGDAKGALRYVQQLLSRGESPTKLWNILLWMVRQALSVCLLEEGVEQGEKKHRTEFVHSSSSQPFRRIAERFSRAGPGYIAAHFLEREEATKSGKIRSSDEHPEEILALLEREILELTSG
jgi:DNA polymerase III delta subunit